MEVLLESKHRLLQDDEPLALDVLKIALGLGNFQSGLQFEPKHV